MYVIVPLKYPISTHSPQMECAQITVTGGTGAKTPATVSIPGAYTVSGWQSQQNTKY